MAQFDLHKNFAYSTVATAPSPATSGTSLVVSVGTGTVFPAAPFNVVIWPAGAQPSQTNAEIARCTAITTDTLTLTRAQEGTGARTVVIGDQIMAAVTAKNFSDIETGASGSVALTTGVSILRATITDAAAATTSKIQVSVRRADVADVDDLCFIYVANIVTQANGSFDVLVVAFDQDGPVSYQAPNETITIVYRIWN